MQTRLFLLVLVFLLQGCVLYTKRDTTVTVVDAESGKPIEGAKIRVSYLYMIVFNLPRPAEGMTDAAGQTTLKIPSLRQVWHVEAPEYLDERRTFLPGERDQQPLPEPWELYREPRPELSLAIPEHFRGLIRLELKHAPEVPGQRRFEASVPPDGLVVVSGGPMLQRAAIVTRSPDTSSQSNALLDPDVVAFRVIERMDSRILCVVGTSADVERVERLIWPLSKDGASRYRSRGAFDALFDFLPLQTN